MRGVFNMKLDLTDMFYAMSFALDRVEMEILGTDTGHGRHVAYLSLLMGREAGFSNEELRDFVGCCLLHDNALTEYIYEEVSQSPRLESLSVKLSELSEPKKTELYHGHSVIGEQNIRLLPFRTDVKNIILFHHENADGSGPFGMTAADIGLKPQILHLADHVDMESHLDTMTLGEFEQVREWVKSEEGTLFSKEAVALFLKAVDYNRIMYLQENGVRPFLHQELPEEILEYSDEEIRHITGMFAKIVDYKSTFTRTHSTDVAKKAEFMAHYYGFGAEKAIRFYFAGAMHDIGKLIVSNDILEKPGKLTFNEFEEMKNHASATYYVLSQMKAIPDILEWAPRHHEKLNGTGYPRGLEAKDLTFEDRLLACIDIYQALTEKRPYKEGLSHEKSISIMMDMVEKGEIDGDIVHDVDVVMKEHFDKQT